MQIQTLSEKNDIPERVHIALDTCVFIDAFHNPEKFQDFFVYIKERKITLATTYLNYLEFSKGFSTIKGFKDAENFFNQTVDFYYSPHLLEDSVEKLKYAYRSDGQRLPIADLFLGSLGLQFGDKMLILTKDHGDFIKALFDVVCYVPYDGDGNQVQIYCLYRFSKEKYTKRLLELGKTE
ncbi:MAG: hypothetical protein NTY30_00420 [Candidatus Berkelbacteria bacterium]|nr:hypothetical protein [Candidatus Berkelbacteria bacterium]